MGKSAAAAADSAESCAAVLSPSLLIYPLPSIADESFLYTVFKHKVGRSLFGGFGRGRFAVLELTDAGMLEKITALIKARDAAAQDAASASVRASPAAEEPAKDATVHNWIDTVTAEQLTLADLFANPGEDGTETADRAGSGATPPVAGGADDAARSLDSGSLNYLMHMTWRGLYSIVVTVSPITVDEMVHCGGVVPAKRAAAGVRSSSNGGGGTRHAEESENAHEADAAREGGRRSGPARDGEHARAPAAPVRPSFPKDCCQKCGSKDHFTRNCDGSGPGDGAAEAEIADPTPPSHAGEKHRVGANAHPPAHKRPREEPPSQPSAQPCTASGGGSSPPKKAFPKDCCQKCGSKDHFTRNCDGSGPAPAAARTASSAPAVAADAAVAPDPAKQHHPHQQQQLQEPLRKEKAPAHPQSVEPPAAAPRPAFVRASKDQCKHCGSESHLSRHCPNK